MTKPKHTYAEFLAKRDKAVKALAKLDEVMNDLNPNYEHGDHLDTDLETFGEQLESDAFAEAFKPRKHTVEVWIARPYVIEIEALDEDDATERAIADFHEYEAGNLVKESPNAMHASLADNLLERHPYSPTVLTEDF